MFIDSETKINSIVNIDENDENLFTEQDRKYIGADHLIEDTTWLKNTTFLENNLDAPVPIIDQKQLVEEEIEEVKQQIDSVRKNRSLTQVINDSFEISKKTPINKKGLKPIGIWNVLPNLLLTKKDDKDNTFVHFV